MILFECSSTMLSCVNWMMRKRRRSKFDTYFLFRKYKKFWCFSYSTKEIRLWRRASLRSAFRIWVANLLLLSTWFHKVWVRMFAEFSSKFEIFWFNWNSISFELNSSIASRVRFSIFKFIEIKMTKDKD